jgi:ornithine cyclodeaminase
LPFTSLIEGLREAFASGKIVTPPRAHLAYDGEAGQDQSTLLLMPAWKPGEELGVKVVTVTPGNGKRTLPSVQGVYLLFDAATGSCTHVFDAAMLTARRTAATSALASSMLSRPESESMLMVGTGVLAPHLIEAHATVRPIRQVMVWGRDSAKSKQLVNSLSLGNGIVVESVTGLEEACGRADIISCATLAKEPLLVGGWIRAGTHIDLVGSYLPTTREVDDAVISGAQLFVDHEGALKESGDLAIPLKTGLLHLEDVRATLSELCNDSKPGRTSAKEITLFKSVGHAMEDLVAARILRRAIG